MTDQARHYPKMPPSGDDETLEQYTDRLSDPERTPYDHTRQRRCLLGVHEECEDPSGKHCKCPCHYVMSPAPRHDDPVTFAVIYPDREPYVDWLHSSGVMFYNRVAVTINFIDNATTIWPDINILLEAVSENRELSFVWLDGLD